MGIARRRRANPRFEAQSARDAVQKMAGAAEIRVRTDLPQEKKISNALHVLVNSEVPSGSSLAAYQAALSYIAVAWNISLLPADQRSDTIQKLIASVAGLDDTTRREAIGNVERLIAKKQDLFPHDRRTIVSWDVRLQGKHLHISAAAFSSAA